MHLLKTYIAVKINTHRKKYPSGRRASSIIAGGTVSPVPSLDLWEWLVTKAGNGFGLALSWKVNGPYVFLSLLQK